MTQISVIIPVFGCSGCLESIHKRLKPVLNKISPQHEIIFIDDGSTDGGWEVILKLVKIDKSVRAIKLSRNFGQHQAISAGIDESVGNWTVVMDCDIQDRPEDISALYRKAKEGYDVVFARRVKRGDSIEKTFLSRVFHLLFVFLSGMPGDVTVGNFSIVSRRVIDKLKTLTEQNSSYLQNLKWFGFKTAYVDVVHDARFTGRTQYSYPKLINYAIDSITAYSDKPLKTAIISGFAIAPISFLYGLWIIVRNILWGIPIAGWPSLIVTLSFFMGVTFIYLGVLGLYIGKIFEEAKHRPHFVVDKMVGFGKK
jgi:polyisoprenyl-phosphate glycosyltransferase